MLFSKRQLRLEEIQVAMAFSGEAYPSIECWTNSVDFLETPDKFRAMVNDLSRGLLEPITQPKTTRLNVAGTGFEAEIVMDTNQFIHETVREFFLSGDGFKLLGLRTGDMVGQGHTTIATACVNYLNAAEFAKLEHKGFLSSARRDCDYVFLNYVVTALFTHLEEAEKHDSCQRQTLEKIHNNRLVGRLKTLLASVLAVPWESDLLFAAINLGLLHTVKRLLSMGFEVNKPCDTPRRYPLLASITQKYNKSDYNNKQLLMVRILKSHGADPTVTTRGKQTVLHPAANTNVEFFREIIRLNGDVNAADWRGARPIHDAAANKDEGSDIIKLLESHGADLNVVDRDGNTALHFAKQVSNSEAHSVLISLGADGSITNHRGERAAEFEWGSVGVSFNRRSSIRNQLILEM